MSNIVNNAILFKLTKLKKIITILSIYSFINREERNFYETEIREGNILDINLLSRDINQKRLEFHKEIIRDRLVYSYFLDLINSKTLIYLDKILFNKKYSKNFYKTLRKVNKNYNLVKITNKAMGIISFALRELRG